MISTLIHCCIFLTAKKMGRYSIERRTNNIREVKALEGDPDAGFSVDSVINSALLEAITNSERDLTGTCTHFQIYYKTITERHTHIKRENAFLILILAELD